MIKTVTTVYTCDGCQKEFLSSSSCKKHEAQCKRKAAAEKARQEKEDKIINHIRLNCSDVNSLRGMIEDHFKNHLGGDLSFTSFAIRGINNDHNGDYIAIRAEGSWKNPCKRRNHKDWEASFSDVFNHWHDVRYPIAGIETGSGGGGSSNFGYELRVYLKQFPLLQAKRDKLNSLEIRRKAYIEEEQRLDRVRHEYVANISRVDVKMMELSGRLGEVRKSIASLSAEESVLIKDINKREKALHAKALAENSELLTPGKEFEYDKDAYSNYKHSLGM